MAERVQGNTVKDGTGDTYYLVCDSNGLLQVAGSLTATVDSEFPAAAAGADNTATPTTTSVYSFQMVYDGATWDFLRGDSTNGVKVQPAVGGAGVVTAVVPRVTLASNDPAVAALAGGLPAALSAGGGLKVGVVDALPAGSNAIGKLAANAGVTIGAVELAATQTLTTVTTVGTVTTITNVVHVDDNAASLTVDNAGTFAVQATVAAGATNIAKAEDVASADADVGVPAMAVRKATPANTSGTDGDYEMLQISGGRLWASATIDAALPAGTALIGKAGIDQTTLGTTNGVTPVAAAIGGATGYSYIGAASANQDSTVVKASAGTLYGIVVLNDASALRFLKIYNSASGPTSASTPILRIPIPHNTAAGGGVAVPIPACGIAFGTGIAFRLTTGVADNDANAITANDVVLNLIYL